MLYANATLACHHRCTVPRGQLSSSHRVRWPSWFLHLWMSTSKSVGQNLSKDNMKIYCKFTTSAHGIWLLYSQWLTLWCGTRCNHYVLSTKSKEGAPKGLSEGGTTARALRRFKRAIRGRLPLKSKLIITNPFLIIIFHFTYFRFLRFFWQHSYTLTKIFTHCSISVSTPSLHCDRTMLPLFSITRYALNCRLLLHYYTDITLFLHVLTLSSRYYHALLSLCMCPSCFVFALLLHSSLLGSRH